MLPSPISSLTFIGSDNDLDLKGLRPLLMTFIAPLLYYYLLMILRPEEASTFVYKIIVLGDSGVGKTCLTVRYCEDYYPTNKQVTVGIDFKDKRVVIDEIMVRLNIFDTAGQEFYNSLARSYYREADAVIFAYSITDKRSFESVKKWAKEFNNSTDSRDAIKILVGTQCDRGEERQVMKEEGLKLMEEIGTLFFFETSAKQNTKINEVFEEIARNLLVRMYRRKKKTQANSKEDLILMLQAETKKNSSCC